MVPSRAANPLTCLQSRWESGSIPTSPLHAIFKSRAEQATQNRQVEGLKVRRFEGSKVRFPHGPPKGVSLQELLFKIKRK